MKRVRTLMNLRVESADPSDTVRQAALKMKNWDVGCLVICRGTQVVGMLTDRDLILRVAAEGRDPGTTRIEEVMTPVPVSCRPEDGLDSAAKLMASAKVRRLPVVGSHGTLVGLLSLGRLTRAGDDTITPPFLASILSPAPPSP